MSHLLSETARALCILVQVCNEPQTSRNAGAVRKAFLGVVYGEI